jgi:hypothetical protein
LPNGSRLGLVEAPSFGAAVEIPAAAWYRRLDPREEWFAQTPLEISLQNGQVLTASNELPQLRRMCRDAE